MDPVLEKKLSELLELTEENNKMLHKMRRSQQWANFLRILYWVMIVGLALGATYYIKPYLNQLLNVYTEGLTGFQAVEDLSSKIPTDLDTLKGLLGK